MSKPFAITELYAWIGIDPHSGDEGVLGADIPGMGMMPLIGADLTRVESLREWAELVGRTTGQRFRLKRYVLTDTLEEHPRRN